MAVANTSSGTATVSVKLVAESGEEHTISVLQAVRLRDVQEVICRLFHKTFPATKACIVERAWTYDDFFNQPFLNSADGDVMRVRFIKTDDPYFYDKFDRKPNLYPPVFKLERKESASPVLVEPREVIN